MFLNVGSDSQSVVHLLLKLVSPAAPVKHTHRCVAAMEAIIMHN